METFFVGTIMESFCSTYFMCLNGSVYTNTIIDLDIFFHIDIKRTLTLMLMMI